MTRELIAIGAVALVAAGCASRGSVQQLHDQLGGLRAEVTDLRHSHELTTSEVARALDDLRALDARHTELHAGLQEHTADAARLRARLDAAEKEWREAKTPAASEPSAAATPATFRAREHGQAVLDFLDFIATYPRHPLAANAQYWIGEAYYVQRDYRHALEEFRRVVEMAPSSRSAADALLRIGLAYTNLRDNSRAQMVWQRVVREYPASEAAGKARALLRQHAARRP
ncbi:MAG: tol-pal system protein YbgF [Candidatus Rokuibacteriota bacterium]|nr:MAG: tol-pal system protein YbgF [Candidatus Rokubacteria bacterium]